MPRRPCRTAGHSRQTFLTRALTSTFSGAMRSRSSDRRIPVLSTFNSSTNRNPPKANTLAAMRVQILLLSQLAISLLSFMAPSRSTSLQMAATRRLAPRGWLNAWSLRALPPVFGSLMSLGDFTRANRVSTGCLSGQMWL